MGNYYQSVFGGSLYYMPVWSLAIEEHFYLFLPALLLWGLSSGGPQRALLWCLAVIVLVLAWRLMVTGLGWYDALQVYRNSDTRLDAPMFGVVLALVFHAWPSGRVARLLRGPAALALGLAILAFTLVLRSDGYDMTLRYTLQGAALTALIAYIVTATDAMAVLGRSALDWAPVRFIGRISYSLYLWHLTTLHFALSLYPGMTPMGAIGVGLVSVALACLSFFFVERPFLGLRRRFGSHAIA